MDWWIDEWIDNGKKVIFKTYVANELITFLLKCTLLMI